MKNSVKTFIKVNAFLILPFLLTFFLQRLLYPSIINRHALNEQLINIFGDILPRSLIQSIPNRLLFFLCISITYFMFSYFIDRKKLSQTLFVAPKPVIHMIKGMLFQSSIYLITFISALIIGLITFKGITEKSLISISISILIDLIIKLPTDLGEELIFRGYGISNLTSIIGSHSAVFYSALIFALIHIPGMPSYDFRLNLSQFLFGILAGYMFIIVGKNIYFTTGMHLGANVLSNHFFYYGSIIKYSEHTKYGFIFLNQVILMVIILGVVLYYRKLIHATNRST